MSPEQQHIVSSCVISNGVVYKNEEPVFENKENDLGLFLLSVYRYLGLQYPKFYKMDKLSKLGWLAAELLLKEDFLIRKYRAEEVGIVLANSSASLDTDIKYYDTVKDIASPALFVYTLPNIMIGEICIRNNIKGENAFFVFDHFDVNFIKEYVSHLLQFNILNICICGWVELMDESYKAVLFLVERESRSAFSADEANVEKAAMHFRRTKQPVLFTEENLSKIYLSEHG